MVSIGFGGNVTATTWDETDFASSYTEAASLSLGLEAMVSVSIPFLATPYAKLAYNFADTYAYVDELDVAGTTQKTAGTSKGSGTTFAIGAKFSLLPFISAMLEYSLYNGELTPDEIKVDGTVGTASTTVTTVSSSSFLVGVELDIGL
jgi:hypothetical protein